MSKVFRLGWFCVAVSSPLWSNTWIRFGVKLLDPVSHCIWKSFLVNKNIILLYSSKGLTVIILLGSHVIIHEHTFDTPAKANISMLCVWNTMKYFHTFCTITQNYSLIGNSTNKIVLSYYLSFFSSHHHIL